jgi:uncharacterized membrane protein
MNKDRFMDLLSKSLRGLPQEEIADIVSDFEEHFDIGIKNGRKESELCDALGDPKTLGRQMKAEAYIKRAEDSVSTQNIFSAVFTSIGLSFFNLLFVLPPFIAVFAVVAALFITSVSLSATGITGFIGALFYNLYEPYVVFDVNPFVGIFAFLGLSSFGLLFFVGNIYLSKGIYKMITRYLRFNLHIIKRRRNK